jgi:endonuclease/exonuclease/phosphatase family metal-dependent hydrolase
MANSGADVICLQEVQTWDEYQPTTFQRYLQQLTGQTWYIVYAPNTSNSGTIGDLILSRIPFIATATTIMQEGSDPGDVNSNRGAARGKISVNGVGVNIINTHLDWFNPSYRWDQLLKLMDWSNAFATPRLDCGDFNAAYDENIYQQMTTQYSDTWHDVTGSYDGALTVDYAVRFDYIFRSFDQNWRVTPTSAWVIDTDRSDHRPFVADFTVR